MNEALFLGFLSAGSLLIGAGFALRFKMSSKVLGLIMSFGVGALISSVSFELIGDAFNESKNITVVAVGSLAGALVYFVGDLLISKFGGKNRKNSTVVSKKNDDSGPAILLGTILDGIPESVVIGLTILQGGVVSVAMLCAVFLSNIPEALSSTTGLLARGWKKRDIIILWLIVVIISTLASLAGYALFAGATDIVRAFTLSFAGGAILTMLANTMLPEAYRNTGKITGLVVILGFLLAFAITTLQ